MTADTALHDNALALMTSADPAHRPYLLADQSALPRIASLWPRIAVLPWASLMPSGATQPDGATPLLIDIADLQTTHRPRLLLNALYEHARYANCLSLIFSGLPFDTLVDALMARTHAELPDNLNVRLRFFDTRTLPLLPRLLNAEQYAAFLGCAGSWHYVDRHGQLRTLPAPRGEHEVAVPYKTLVFDTEQERLLIDDGTVDAVIDQLLDQRHPAFAGTTPPQQYDLIAALADAARAFNVVEVNDVLLYCCTALEQGADFHRRSPWSERLAAHRRGTLTLAEALTDVP